MVKWRRAPASRDGTHPLGPRALELRTTARPPRGDRAAARRAGARPGRGAEAVRRGHRAAPRGTRAADRRRGAGEAGAVGPGWPSQGRELLRLNASETLISIVPFGVKVNKLLGSSGARRIAIPIGETAGLNLGG